MVIRIALEVKVKVILVVYFIVNRLKTCLAVVAAVGAIAEVTI